MRLEERRIVKVVVVLGALAAIGAGAFPFAIYFFGLALAPPRPVAESTSAPGVLRDALWARVDGGGATGLRPINPITMAHLFACLARAPGNNDNERMRECRNVMPGFSGVEYIAKLHIEDHGVVRNSFRGGHSHLATTVWMTRSWSKDDFLNTVAARGQFGFGWRGVTMAASRYFDKPPSALTLSEAAYIASRLAEVGDDPWCHSKTAVSMRNQLLTRMRDNGVINDDDLRHASSVPLEFAPPPESRPPCSK
jgi:hypothetical protein